MTNAQLRGLCVALAPDFRAAWQPDQDWGRVFTATCTERGKPQELSIAESGDDERDENMVLRACYEQLNK